MDTKKTLIPAPTRRNVITGMAAAGLATGLPGIARFAQAGSHSGPIKIGFQVHRTGIGAAYG
ncbi:MAG TPA: ABC transporter substrate-binding protein, partial [Aliiroseovarius sp.]|nr:ABC transporter substrate-binding protein [Aliiroseovarius sp.]